MKPFADPPFKLTNKIGILDPEAKAVNPLTGKSYTDPDSYKHLAFNSPHWVKFSIFKDHKNILNLLNKYQIVCARAGTGSGKTVLFPKFALHVGGYKKKVLVAIPKQIITSESAVFAAKTLDVKIGEEVGFFYRGNRAVSSKSLLTYTTTGSVNSLIKRDPLLSDYDYLVIDEAHERTKDMDMLLLFVKELVQKRDNIKIIIMSATIDPLLYKQYFSDIKTLSFVPLTIEGSKSPFPRRLIYRDPAQQLRKGTDTQIIGDELYKMILRIIQKPPLRNDHILIRDFLKIMKKEGTYIASSDPIVTNITDGDIIAFVPFVSIGKKICERLQKAKKSLQLPNFFCTILEGKSRKRYIKDSKGNFVYTDNGEKASEQYYATNETAYKKHPTSNPLDPFQRKVVLTTNVAESSITIKGASYVIDSGVGNESAFHSQSSVNSLRLEYVAQDAIVQRQGRVGRSSPGVVYHLYTEEQFNAFDKITTPDFRKSDLTGEILEMMSMDGKDTVQNVRAFFNQLIEPPKEEFIASALLNLHHLGAITSVSEIGVRTLFGRAMSYFRAPITPCQAKCLILSMYYNCSLEMAQIIALVDACSGKDMTSTMLANNKLPIHPHILSAYGDHLTMLHAYHRFAAATDKFAICKKYNLSPHFFANVEELSSKIHNNLRTLFEREDDLLQVDNSLVLDETNMIEKKNRIMPTRHGNKHQHTRRHNRGGTFNVTDDLELSGVNPSGVKDLEILYALYPQCQRKVRCLVTHIMKEDDPQQSTVNISADRAQTLLLSRIQQYHSEAFSALSVQEQKKVLSALRNAIQFREQALEHITHKTSKMKEGETITELNQMKGHQAWVKNLKIYLHHALRKHHSDKTGMYIERKKKVKEMLYTYIEDLPEDIYNWNNVEDRLLRVLFEGYFIQSAYRAHKTDKKLHTLYPQKSTLCTISKDSSLHKTKRNQSENVCLYEEIKYIVWANDINFVNCTTLSARVHQNAQVKKMLDTMVKHTLPYLTGLPRTRSSKHHKPVRTKKKRKKNASMKHNQTQKKNTNYYSKKRSIHNRQQSKSRINVQRMI